MWEEYTCRRAACSMESVCRQQELLVRDWMRVPLPEGGRREKVAVGGACQGTELSIVRR